MGRFSHIQWYEWLGYSIYLAQAVPDIIYLLQVVAGNNLSSPWLPLYASYIAPVSAFAQLASIAGCAGLILLLQKKRPGWFLFLTGLFYSVLKIVIGLLYLMLSNTPEWMSLWFLWTAMAFFVLAFLSGIQMQDKVRNLYSIKKWHIVPPALVGLCMAILNYNAVSVSIFLSNVIG